MAAADKGQHGETVGIGAHHPIAYIGVAKVEWFLRGRQYLCVASSNPFFHTLLGGGNKMWSPTAGEVSCPASGGGVSAGGSDNRFDPEEPAS